MFVKKRDSDEGRSTPPNSPQPCRHPRSSPASPALSKRGKRNPSTSPIRHLLNSPLLNRKNRKKQQAESSDDESSYNNSNDDGPGRYSYRDLETFQKAQLRQKVWFFFSFLFIKFRVLHGFIFALFFFFVCLLN